jgi:hypothetical protein
MSETPSTPGRSEYSSSEPVVDVYQRSPLERIKGIVMAVERENPNASFPIWCQSFPVTYNDYDKYDRLDCERRAVIVYETFKTTWASHVMTLKQHLLSSYPELKKEGLTRQDVQYIVEQEACHTVEFTGIEVIFKVSFPENGVCRLITRRINKKEVIARFLYLFSRALGPDYKCDSNAAGEKTLLHVLISILIVFQFVYGFFVKLITSSHWLQLPGILLLVSGTGFTLAFILPALTFPLRHRISSFSIKALDLRRTSFWGNTTFKVMIPIPIVFAAMSALTSILQGSSIYYSRDGNVGLCSEFNQIYDLNAEEWGSSNAKLESLQLSLDNARARYGKILSAYTSPTTEMSGIDWYTEFQTECPNVTDDTECLKKFLNEKNEVENYLESMKGLRLLLHRDSYDDAVMREAFSEALSDSYLKLLECKEPEPASTTTSETDSTTTSTTTSETDSTTTPETVHLAEFGLCVEGILESASTLKVYEGPGSLNDTLWMARLLEYSLHPQIINLRDLLFKMQPDDSQYVVSQLVDQMKATFVVLNAELRVDTNFKEAFETHLEKMGLTYDEVKHERLYHGQRLLTTLEIFERPLRDLHHQLDPATKAAHGLVFVTKSLALIKETDESFDLKSSDLWSLLKDLLPAEEDLTALWEAATPMTPKESHLRIDLGGHWTPHFHTAQEFYKEHLKLLESVYTPYSTLPVHSDFRRETLQTLVALRWHFLTTSLADQAVSDMFSPTLNLLTDLEESHNGLGTLSVSNIKNDVDLEVESYLIRKTEDLKEVLEILRPALSVDEFVEQAISLLKRASPPQNSDKNVEERLQPLVGDIVEDLEAKIKSHTSDEKTLEAPEIAARLLILREDAMKALAKEVKKESPEEKTVEETMTRDEMLKRMTSDMALSCSLFQDSAECEAGFQDSLVNANPYSRRPLPETKELFLQETYDYWLFAFVCILGVVASVAWSRMTTESIHPYGYFPFGCLLGLLIINYIYHIRGLTRLDEVDPYRLHIDQRMPVSYFKNLFTGCIIASCVALGLWVLNTFLVKVRKSTNSRARTTWFFSWIIIFVIVIFTLVLDFEATGLEGLNQSITFFSIFTTQIIWLGMISA